MLKFCLTFDCEGFSMFSQGNPEYNGWQNFKFLINKSIRRIRYDERGFFNAYSEIKRNKFPCTLMLTGRLFRPLENNEFIEWGYHTKNHAPLNLLNEEKIRVEIKNVYNAKSITVPMWRVEDLKNPARIYNLLKEEGYRNTVYHGPCLGKRTMYWTEVKKSEIRFGIKCVHVSNYFEGVWGAKRINCVKRDIIKNLGKEGVYLLTTHDFTHKNTKNLREIIRFARKLEKDGKIEIIKLNDA
jgi:hypothetical protein